MRAKTITASSLFPPDSAFAGIHWYERNAGSQRIRCKQKEAMDGQLSEPYVCCHPPDSLWPGHIGPRAGRPPRFLTPIPFQ